MRDTVLIHEIENPTTGVFDYIPVESEYEGLCDLCNDNYAEKEIVYERTAYGVTKRFKEPVCQMCLDNDPEYFVGKIIIKIIDL